MNDAPAGGSPRAQATRRRILDAAIAEFTAKGLDGARVDEIAARAGANKRMLYAYFGSKEDLWLAALEAVYGAMRAEESRIDIEHLSPEEGIAELVRFKLRYTAAHPEVVALLTSENLHRARYLRRSSRVPALYSPVVAMLETLLARGAAEGRFRDGVDPVQLYISLTALSHFYLANGHTLSVIFGRDLLSEQAIAAREAHAVEVILGFLRRPR
ncbi:TetR family transcriptional regulator [Elioraea sp. Yellowstone]|jgi:AcrR family transcriptional regulator|uniref:TetR family transcriptional regulator n=1 Tax=Elioraea sp. Yellowstone TaxID=2592070 RepID=UPI00114EC935|nr:TetR family transcriptional regulator [Elioraea sp. Yellowstone]TQF78970.1 TetR family transcriptional regulator [Elioraea sp. Yellowstone]